MSAYHYPLRQARSQLALCERSIYRDVLKLSMQASAKSKIRVAKHGLQRFDTVEKMVGGTRIELVTPTMST